MEKERETSEMEESSTRDDVKIHEDPLDRVRILQEELDKVRLERNELRVQQEQLKSQFDQYEKESVKKWEASLSEKQQDITSLTNMIEAKNDELKDIRESMTSGNNHIEMANKIIERDKQLQCVVCKAKFLVPEFIKFQCGHRMHKSCFAGRAFIGNQSCMECKDVIPFIDYKEYNTMRVCSEQFRFMRLSDAVQANEILKRLQSESYDVESGVSVVKSHINTLLQVLQSVYTARNKPHVNRLVARNWASLYRKDRKDCVLVPLIENSGVEPLHYRNLAKKTINEESEKIVKRQFKELAAHSGITVIKEDDLPHSVDTTAGRLKNALYAFVFASEETKPQVVEKMETKKEQQNVHILEKQLPISILYFHYHIDADVLVENHITASYWFERGYTLTDLFVLGSKREHLRDLELTAEIIHRYKYKQLSLELLRECFGVGFYEIVLDFSLGKLENFLGYSWTKRDLELMGFSFNTLTSLYARPLHFIQLIDKFTLVELKNSFGLLFNHFLKLKLTREILELYQCSFDQVVAAFPQSKKDIEHFWNGGSTTTIKNNTADPVKLLDEKTTQALIADPDPEPQDEYQLDENIDFF